VERRRQQPWCFVRQLQPLVICVVACSESGRPPSCPKAVPPCTAVCVSPGDRAPAVPSLVTSDGRIGIGGPYTVGDDQTQPVAQEARVGVLDTQGTWLLRPMAVYRDSLVEMKLAAGDGKIWALRNSGSSDGGLEIAYDVWTPGGLVVGAGRVPRDGAAMKLIQLTEVAATPDGFIVAWGGYSPTSVGVTLLDGQMGLRKSTILAEKPAWAYGAVSGDQLLAVAWRDDTNYSGPVYIDLLNPDLSLHRRVKMPVSPVTTGVLMLWREGGFDVFWGKGIAGPIGYGRISADQDELWTDDFHGDPSQRNEVYGLHRDLRGQTWLLLMRDSIGRKEDPQAVLGRLTFGTGTPNFEEVWVSDSDYFDARLAPLGDDVLVSAPKLGDVFLARIACGT